jgi:hypothetical protein
VNGILIAPGASGSIVDGFRVANAIGEGILATYVHDVTISNNTVTKNDKGATSPSTYPPCQAQGQVPGDCGEGLHLQGTRNTQVLGNIVVRNVGGILVSDDVARSHDNRIAFNLAADNALDCGITLPSHTPGLGVFRNVVEYNTSIDNGGAGVLLAASEPGTSAHDNVVRHNVIFGNGEVGVQLHAHAPNQSIDDNRITYNTIGTNNTTGDPDAGDFKTTGVIVFSAVVPVNGTVVRHNVISNDRIGIWLSKNVSTAHINDNVFVHVGTHVFQ